MYRYTRVLDGQFFRAHGIDPIRLGGNDRRRIANGLCEDWLKNRGHRLGRDYMVDLVPARQSLLRPAGQLRCYEVLLDIKDPNVAILFKLTWGGRV